jgi:dCTP deaminase
VARGQTQAARVALELDPGILVDRQIMDARHSGLLTIDPFDEESLEPASYDLGVGDVAVVSTVSSPIDLREQPLLTLEPFASAMLQTEEVLHLSPRIVGRLGPRSNLLRHGIFVSTGPQIDPGFSGRLFVNLLNVTDHPFLIRHRSRFLTVEFHALSVAPRKSYAGPHQNRTEFSDEQINAILGRGGASLKEIHRALLDTQGPLKVAAALGQEVPALVDLQQETLRRASELLGGLKQLAVNRTGSVIVPITTLGDGSYRLRRDLPVVVQPTDDAYTATFFDASVSMSGDTQEEAVDNLKLYLIDLLDDLEAEPPERLGPGPARQLAALRAVIDRTA